MTVITDHTRWMTVRGLAEETVAKRRRLLIGLEAVAGDLTEATEIGVERFLASRNLTAKGRYDALSHLSAFYKWAIDYELVERDPTVRIPRPKLRRALPRPLRSEDVATAIAAADTQMTAWLTMMAFCGCRCIEIARLHVEDVQFDLDQVRLHGKGGRDRIIPLHPAVKAALTEYPMPKSGPVFTRPRGGAWPAAKVSKAVSDHLEDCGVVGTAHQLRHWFATHVYASCRDLRVTQEMLGHASPQTTAIYADWSRDDAIAAVQSLDLVG